jgi:hypothetical protein
MAFTTGKPIRFWDDDLNFWEDGKLVALWVLGFAIAVPLIQRVFLWVQLGLVLTFSRSQED